MTRAQHGQYDQARKLPYNAGHAVGSGYIVRMNERVAAYDPQLLADSRRPDRGHAWLIRQLRTRDDVTATAIVSTYEEDRRHESLIRTQQGRYRLLVALQEQQIAHASHQKRIAKLEAQIAQINGKYKWMAAEIEKRAGHE